jgi:branched-chain amino acid transport system substrate-binding protein
MLINSAVVAPKGDLSNKDVVRNALRKADFKSERGSFKFNHNHFPIRDFYLQEVVKDETGEFTMKSLGVVAKDSADPYADKCSMKW